MNPSSRSVVLRFLIVVATAIAAAGWSGCVVAAAAAAAGAVAYVKADLNATLGENVPTVARATKQAITDLRFFELANKQDAVTAEFVVRNAKDERITIKLTKSGERLTKIKIHVGILGNEELSRAILDEIEKNL